MDLADHLRIMLSSWWRILLAGVVVGGVSYAFSASHPKVYAADQLLIVTSQTPAMQFSRTQLDLRVAFYAAVGNTPTIAAAAKKTAHLDSLTVDKVRSNTLVSVTGTTGIIQVNTTGRSQIEAAQIANGISTALHNFVSDQVTANTDAAKAALRRRINALENGLRSNVVQADPTLREFVQQQLTAVQQNFLTIAPDGFDVTGLTVAVPRPAAISPHPRKAGLLGFFVSIIIVGEGIVIARGFKDRFMRTNDVEQITGFTGLPVLALVPRGRGPDVVEAFRTLRTNLMFLEGAGRPRTIAIVSPNAGAGKSFAAVHLAESAAGIDTSVVLIDADLRHPVLHSRLRCDREPGLSNVLQGGDLPSTLQRVDGISNLTLIASGSPVDDAVGVFGGRMFRRMLDSLDFAELIVIDTPPGAVYADAMAVSVQCDATLLLLDSKSTSRRAARTLIDTLERTGATMIGVVVNNAQLNRRDTYERA